MASFYAIPCLKTILIEPYLKHLTKLITSFHYLLSSSIDVNKVPVYQNQINQFVKEFEKYYGQSQMTMNVHKLTHLVQYVKDSGPLWAYSTFAFESKNGTILKYVKGTKDVLLQVATKCALNQYFCRRERKTFYKNEITRPLGKKCMHDISNANLRNAIVNSVLSKCLSNNKIQIFFYVIHKSQKVRRFCCQNV